MLCEQCRLRAVPKIRHAAVFWAERTEVGTWVCKAVSMRCADSTRLAIRGLPTSRTSSQRPQSSAESSDE
jgi:hypothetical protein